MIGKESTSDNRKIARPETTTTMLAHITCNFDVQDVDNEVAVKHNHRHYQHHRIHHHHQQREYALVSLRWRHSSVPVPGVEASAGLAPQIAPRDLVD